MAQTVKNLPANAEDIRDVGLTPGLGRSPGEGNGNTLPYSCLGTPMDRGAWRATVHGVAKSLTRLRTKHAVTSKKASESFQNDLMQKEVKTILRTVSDFVPKECSELSKDCNRILIVVC